MKRPLLLTFILSLCALFWLGAKAQDIGTPAADGANTAVTIKHVVRLERIQADRDGSVTWFYSRVKFNNADDTVIGKPEDWFAVTRPLTTVMADSVQHAGQPVTGTTTFTVLAKFGEKYRAE